MTSTLQMIRQTTNSKQIGSWSANFPETITTEAQSLLFAKKMIAIAISEITYLRTMFPEMAYEERSIEAFSPERGEPEAKRMSCPCNNLKSTSELMLECTICKTWQHGICYSILDVSQVPSNHVCYDCASADIDRQPTDPSLMGLPDVEVAATCLFRRTLALIRNKDRVNATMLKKDLEVDILRATALYYRLLSEGIVKKGRVSKNINKDVLKEAIPKYFQRKPLANDNLMTTLKRKTNKKRVNATDKSVAKKRQSVSSVELDFSPETENPKKGNKRHRTSKSRKKKTTI